MTDSQTSPTAPLGSPGDSPPSIRVSPAPSLEDPGFTLAQLQQMAEWAVADGSLTQQQADEALQPGSVPPTDAPANELELPDISPEAAKYKMPPIRDENGQYGREAMIFDRQARTWLEAAGFDREGGSYVAAEIDRAVSKWETLTEPGRKLYEAEQRTMLERLWGNDFAANRALVCEFVDGLEAKHPGIIGTLAKSGVGKSAALMTQLYFRAVEARNAQAQRG